MKAFIFNGRYILVKVNPYWPWQEDNNDDNNAMWLVDMPLSIYFLQIFFCKFIHAMNTGVWNDNESHGVYKTLIVD